MLLLLILPLLLLPATRCTGEATSRLLKIPSASPARNVVTRKGALLRGLVVLTGRDMLVFNDVEIC
jgi:hypothetical protein